MAVLIRRICYCTTLLSGIFTDRTVQATQSFLSTNEQIEIVILQGAIMHTEYIWRYLDIEKFSMLLEQNALFFCSAKNFEDPFEGEFAWGHTGYKKFIETQEKLCATHGAGMDLDPFMAFNLKTLKEISERTYISCWHCNEHESEAMWKLYCKNPAKGVVIKSKKKTSKANLKIII